MKVIKSNQYYIFKCPGCGDTHVIDDTWDFNGDYDRPTLSPSVLVKTGHNIDGSICHSFIRDGQIMYLPDSTHELAGQTVELGEMK